MMGQHEELSNDAISSPQNLKNVIGFSRAKMVAVVSRFKHLASKLATKWQRSYSVVMNWARVRTQFAIIRAVDLQL